MRVFKRLIAVAMGIILLWGGTAIAADNEVVAEMKETARSIGEYSVEQKDAAVAKAKELMEKLDVRLEQWEEDIDVKMGALQQSTREKTKESKKQLRRQRNELSEWYGRMKDSSKDAWLDVKKGFSTAYESVVDSWEQADRQVEDGQK